MTTHPHRVHIHRPHVNPWLIAVVVLAAALVGLGIYMLADRETNARGGFASAAVVTMLENRIAAMNSKSGSDGVAAAAFYSKDAVLEERDQIPAVVTKGREQIAARLAFLNVAGMRLTSLGTPLQSGRYVGEAVRFYQYQGPGTGEGILVFELDQSGKIVHQWVMGETR